jgi:sensor domain CHASE-containing protein
MKIHTRTLLILGITVFILIFAMNFLAQFFILSSYAQVEQEESATDVQRVADQIHVEEMRLSENARDWAVWDDSYRFMEDHNDGFRISTIEPASSYESLQINGILYYDTSGQLVIGRWYDLQNKTFIAVPQNLLFYVSGHPRILLNGTGMDEEEGLILLSGEPELVSVHSVLPSSGTGPSHGTLVMVRSYDQPRIADLEKRLYLPVRLLPIRSPADLDPDLARVSASGSPVILTRPQDVNTITGYTLVRDINDQPILLLQVDSPRHVYQQAMATLIFLLTAFLVIGVIYVVATELLLRRYIISPLMNLDASMKEIGQRRDLSERLPSNGDDEIASLRGSLNEMLQELQDKETELAKRGELLAEANRKANLYLDIYMDVLTYEILNSTMSIRGYADLIRSGAGEKEGHFAQRIIDIISRDTDVIRNIETISKIFKNPPARAPVSLDGTIQKLINSFPGIAIQWQNSGITVLADTMLSTVFDNIISNCIKFGGRDVEIHISTRDLNDGTVEISVTDTGRGIPDPAKAGIFDRFMQGSDKRSSYGLGLHIVKMLVEAYGGRVWADDRIPGQPEKGAAIRFTLMKG